MISANRRIYIVIPVFNKIDYTLNCLQSLENQTYEHYEVIVVDDGSSDGTTEKIVKRFPHVTVLQGDGHLWWTGGTNMGVKYAIEKASKHDFVLTLNNDLEVNPNYLEELVKVYDRQQPCLVGSLSVNINQSDKIEYLGSKWNSYTAKSRPTVSNLTYQQVIDKYDHISSDTLPGRGTLIPLEVFKRIGLYDFEYFPQYLADYDFSRRALKAGYQLWVAPRAVVKSIVESTGLSYKMSPSFSVFFKSLTSIKSPNRLITKYHYGRRHSPLKSGYVVISFIRITVSFLREMILNKRKVAIKS